MIPDATTPADPTEDAEPGVVSWPGPVAVPGIGDVLVDDLDEVISDVFGGSNTAQSIAMLRRDLRLAVRSFRGFSLVLTVPGPSVSVAINVVDGPLDPDNSGEAIAVQLPALHRGYRASLTVYAEREGSLDHLRTELADALGRPLATLDSAALRHPVTSGVDGLARFADVNQAIGYLIGTGHTFETANIELIRQAHADPDGLHGAALAILNQAAEGSRAAGDH